LSGINKSACAGVSLSHFSGNKLLILRHYGYFNIKVIFFCEFKVPLIVGRNSHNCTCSIVHEDKVGYENRHPASVEGIYDIFSGEEAFLLLIICHTVYFIFLENSFNEVKSFLFLLCSGEEFLGNRMFRRHRHESGSEKRVCPCGEYGYFFIGVFNIKIYFSAKGLAYPVLLHCENFFWPAVHLFST